MPPRPRSGSGAERVGFNLINDVVARRLTEHDLACQVDARDQRNGLATRVDQVVSHGEGSVTTLVVTSSRTTTPARPLETRRIPRRTTPGAIATITDQRR